MSSERASHDWLGWFDDVSPWPLGPTQPVEHWVEQQGETLTNARAAGTPPRLVCSNPLFCCLLLCRWWLNDALRCGDC